MADTILVVAEQREGKLNRVSFETVRCAQSIGSETGWLVDAALLVAGISASASELAAAKVNKVYVIDSPKLERYTADAYVAALKQFISDKKPRLVLMPHTYQVRDFAPKLTTALGRTLISDAIGYKKEGDKLVFTRQMFQGKFSADVSFNCDPPHFATFQAGAYRGDQVEKGAGAAPVEAVNVSVDDTPVRVK